MSRITLGLRGLQRGKDYSVVGSANACAAVHHALE
jgi:hypothetical protein